MASEIVELGVCFKLFVKPLKGAKPTHDTHFGSISSEDLEALSKFFRKNAPFKVSAVLAGQVTRESVSSARANEIGWFKANKLANSEFSDLSRYYYKLFGSLAKKDARLLFELVRNSDIDNMAWNNSFGNNDEELTPAVPKTKADILAEKKKFLKGLLAGASLDNIEYLSKSFQLVKFKDAKPTNCNAIVFVSAPALKTTHFLKEATYLVQGLESRNNSPNWCYTAFVFHNFDRENYVLLGENYPPKIAKKMSAIVGSNEIG